MKKYIVLALMPILLQGTLLCSDIRSKKATYEAAKAAFAANMKNIELGDRYVQAQVSYKYALLDSRNDAEYNILVQEEKTDMYKAGMRASMKFATKTTTY